MTSRCESLRLSFCSRAIVRDPVTRRPAEKITGPAEIESREEPASVQLERLSEIDLLDYGITREGKRRASP
jgi:hypothetical protein